MRSVIQGWVCSLPMMQQTVLLTAIRGPDGSPKYSGTKMLLRWYRRCVLLSAMDGKVLNTPCGSNGGSFTGPSFVPAATSSPWDGTWEVEMDAIVGEYIKETDGLPHHFQMHFLHAAQIIGYKHPSVRIRAWWNSVYVRLVNDFHLREESEEEMDGRLGDKREGWLRRADKATTK